MDETNMNNPEKYEHVGVNIDSYTANDNLLKDQMEEYNKAKKEYDDKNTDPTAAQSFWEPKWVRLKMASRVFPGKVMDDDGRARLNYNTTPDGFIDVPENLVDDVRNGKLNPNLYTREQLRQMSIDRYHLTHGINIPVYDDYSNDIIENQDKSR
ncbi:MAG: hypothetical protein IKG27_02610 [Bacilli bacterium]|nr:hypothetical protein [Bacilli bacterium]